MGEVTAVLRRSKSAVKQRRISGSATLPWSATHKSHIQNQQHHQLMTRIREFQVILNFSPAKRAALASCFHSCLLGFSQEWAPCITACGSNVAKLLGKRDGLLREKTSLIFEKHLQRRKPFLLLSHDVQQQPEHRLIFHESSCSCTHKQSCFHVCLHYIHTFSEHCHSCPAPGLCEQHKQHQELPSSPQGVWLTQQHRLKPTEFSLWLKVWTALKHFPWPLHGFHWGMPQQHPGVCSFFILSSTLDSQKPFTQLAGWFNWSSLVFWRAIWFCPHLQAEDICVCLFLFRGGWETVCSSLRNGTGSQRPWTAPGWTELWYQSSWQTGHV